MSPAAMLLMALFLVAMCVYYSRITRAEMSLVDRIVCILFPFAGIAYLLWSENDKPKPEDDKPKPMSDDKVREMDDEWWSMKK